MFFWLLFYSTFAFGQDCKSSFENKPASALVIGAGAFGLSFSQLISKSFKETLVLGRDKQAISNIKRYRKSDKLPEIVLSDKIKAYLNWKDFLNKELKLLVLALPFNQISDFIEFNHESLSYILKKNKDLSIISLSKGLAVSPEKEILLVEDLLQSRLKPFFNKNNFYVLSGPSFALDLAQEEKTLVNLAGYNKDKLADLKQLIESPYLKVELSRDVKGVAFGGSIKNIMAILAGLLKALNLSQNSQTAFILKGTQELIQIGKSLGTKRKTYLGPSYFGDLILSLSQSSRNSQLGFAIGQGIGLKEFRRQNPQMSIEGLNTIKELYQYTKNKKEYPLINSLYSIIYEEQEPLSILNSW